MNWQNNLGNMPGILFTKGVSLFHVSPLKAMMTANSLSSATFPNTIFPDNIITCSTAGTWLHPAIDQKNRRDGFFQSLSQISLQTYFIKQFADFFSKNSAGCFLVISLKGITGKRFIVPVSIFLLLVSAYHQLNKCFEAGFMYNILMS